MSDGAELALAAGIPCALLVVVAVLAWRTLRRGSVQAHMAAKTRCVWWAGGTTDWRRVDVL